MRSQILRKLIFLLCTAFLLSGCLGGVGLSEAVAPDPSKNLPKFSNFNSEITISSAYLLQGETATITLASKDQNGNPFSEGGKTVLFATTIGTSQGTFSQVIDHQDGTYSTVFTATQEGSLTTIQSTVNGAVVANSTSVRVVYGKYQNIISLSNSLSSNESQFKLELSSANIDYANFKTNGEDLRITDSYSILQPYWIEKWDPTGVSIVWVKVLNASNTSFELYYGNNSLSSVSNRQTTFSYSSAEELYVELSSHSGASGLNTPVMSWFSGNTVTVQDSGGSSSYTYSSNYENHTFANLTQGVISAFSGISGRGASSNISIDTIMSISAFATTDTGYAISRGTDNYDFYNPNSTAANLTLSDYDTSGNLLSNTNYVVNAKSFLSFIQDVTVVTISSDQKILSYYSSGSTNDGVSLFGASKDVLGVNSNTGYILCLVNSTNLTIYYSTSSSSNHTCNRGQRVQISNSGTQGSGEAVRIISDQKIVAHSQADSDGSESFAYSPYEELDQEYLVTSNSQYIAVSCPYTTIVTVYNPDQTVYGTSTCTANGSSPGKSYFGTTGSGTPILAGSRISGDQSFFAYWEYDNQDETNFSGLKSARKYQDNDITISLGSTNQLL